MSRTDLRRLAWIALAALAARLAVAALTEAVPLFPSYYYTDARLADEAAAAAAKGPPYAFVGNLSQLLQVRAQAGLYALVGVHPLAMKAFHSLLGAAGVAALGAAAILAFGPASGLAAALLCAFWPSNVFYGSQNFKESPTNLLAYAALTALAALLAPAGRRPHAAAGLAAAACSLMVATGFYRPYLLLALCAATLLACAAARGGTRPAAAWGLAAALLAPVLYRPLSGLAHAALAYETGYPAMDHPDVDPRLRVGLVPIAYDTRVNQVSYSPTSPRGITRFRQERYESDRQFARKASGREIATQIYPDARFETWLDVLLFVPKGAFHALFMPLPGLYPIDGRLGRALASAENVVLLLLALAAAAGALRGPWTPARSAFLGLFLLMACGSALLEFDLGSAGRHKTFFLPLLFPFAAEELARLRRRT